MPALLKMTVTMYMIMSRYCPLYSRLSLHI